ncbi:hypothetical protein VNO80_13038 [Phaseolus coccineus]|uniref:Uncharacterized protein n=1 Tax=Phaseolus coccineus TaxID=3886 RepID=A0AAN9N5M1_PHACN
MQREIATRGLSRAIYKTKQLGQNKEELKVQVLRWKKATVLLGKSTKRAEEEVKTRPTCVSELTMSLTLVSQI